MVVSLQLAGDVAGFFQRSGAKSPLTDQLLATIHRYGVRLQPAFPGAAEPELVRHFLIETPDAAIAERLIEELRQNSAVEAAYVKPTDELP